MTSLREERERRGWKKLRAVTQLEHLASEQGTSVSQRSSLLRQLARWENGEKPTGWTGPDEPYRSLFCRLYERQPSDFGWAPQRPLGAQNLGPPAEFHSSLADSVASLQAIGSQEARAPSPQVDAAGDPDGITAVAMEWLFTSLQDDVKRDPAVLVGAGQVEEIRATTRTLDLLDRQVGGEQSRLVAARYLNDRVVPLLSGSATDEVSRELFQAAAVLCELVGWMSYDNGRNALAQRYFAQALRMAKGAGDRNYGAYVLGSMSDQALFLGHAKQAALLARAAAESSSAAPSVQVEAALLEAKAHAAMRDRSSVTAALARADKAFSAIGPDDSTQEYAPVSPLIMLSHAGTCWVSLGEPGPAAESFTEALALMKDQPRRRVYGTIQLANIALLNHDLDAAVTLGSGAVSNLGGQASYRSAHHLRTLVSRVEAVDMSSKSSGFLDLARSALKSQSRPLANKS